MLKSGVHATVAGILLALTIPARTYLDRDHFLKRSRWLLDRVAAARLQSFEEHAAIHTLEAQYRLVESPLHRIEQHLQPWVSFLVMPLFAFANAGVHILGSIAEATKHPVTLGVVLGLFAGKPLGIMLFAWCSSRTKLTTPPAGVPWRQVFGAGCLCGIGFTMSLFVATLALSEGNLLNMSKIGILAASVGAGICGSLILSGRNSQLGQCSRFSPNN